MIRGKSIKEIFLLALFFEILISLVIVSAAQFYVLLAASLNILSFINVCIMGYRLRKKNMGYWKILLFGLMLLFIGVVILIVMRMFSGDLDRMLFKGLVLSSIVFSPFYGLLSVVGAYAFGIKRKYKTPIN